MYISEILIKNYRNFNKDSSPIYFSDGVNVIIGHNNAGKTNLIKALKLVLDPHKSKRDITIDDFNKEISDFTLPPEINITVTFKRSKDEPEDHKVLVYEWITLMQEEYEAKLTYSFFLPQGEDYNEYCKEIKRFQKDDGSFDDEVWYFIKKYYLPKYVIKTYGGNPDRKSIADNEMLNKFDFQFLEAIRDAEKQMFFGNNTVLKQVLHYFLDYDITRGRRLLDLDIKQVKELKEKEESFKNLSNDILVQLQNRIAKDKVFSYAEKTGAKRAGNPNFDGYMDEEELLFALRLIVEIDNMKIPISNNGLGYNNLLFIALVLAKMQIESESSYYGENAKVFPILAIEEPEAHLHPSLQFKLLKFLKENVSMQNKVRQVFLTTHSTHITSAVELDDIICMYKDIEDNFKIGYIGKAFGDNNSSKNYVKRFLDATKSNMLFADRVLFVEGLAEQILIPCFASFKKLDNDKTNEDALIDQHVGIVPVDSRTFKHFIELFTYSKENRYALNKKVVCITDSDPEKLGANKRWNGCFPFDLTGDEKSHSIASHVYDLKTNYQEKYNNIFVYHPKAGKGKTLEYEIMRYNPDNELLITDSFPKLNSPHTKKNFKKLLSKIKKDKKDVEGISNCYIKMLSEAKKEEFKKITKLICKVDWNEEEKVKAIISYVYYNIVKNLKGENALYLEANLRRDSESDRPTFNVPDYIRDAISKVVE